MRPQPITVSDAKWVAHPLTSFVLVSSYFGCIILAVDILVRLFP